MSDSSFLIDTGRDWWQKLDELQLKLKWRKMCKRREVNGRRRKILFDNWFPFHERWWKASIYRSLFNCAHSVAFQNQLIIISFVSPHRSFFSLPLTVWVDLWITMKCCYALNDAYTSGWLLVLLDKFHIVWTFKC